jgi:hypothetical protein
LISQFSGDEIVSKFNCLKQTLSENWKDYHKNALQLVDTYPNSEEGKNAQEIVTIKFQKKWIEYNTPVNGKFYTK